MKSVTCPCGEKRAFRKDLGGAVGAIMDASGFHPLFSNMGEMVWLCPGCAQKVSVLMKQLMVLVGNDKYMAFVSLLKMSEKLWAKQEEENNGKEAPPD